MSKAFATLLVVASMLPIVSFAAVCGDGTNGTVQCGNGSPEMVSNVWGGTNSDVPHILPGQTRTNKFGRVNTCPFFFTNYCVDISETTYFIERWGK